MSAIVSPRLSALVAELDMTKSRQLELLRQINSLVASDIAQLDATTTAGVVVANGSNGNVKSTAPAAVKKTESGRYRKGDNNGLSLKKAIFMLLDRPGHENGLRPGDIAKILKQENWKSKSSDITSMVQTALGQLKSADKIARSEDRKYYVPEGREWDEKVIASDSTA